MAGAKWMRLTRKCERISKIDDINDPQTKPKKPIWPWLLLLVTTLIFIYAYFILTSMIDNILADAKDIVQAIEWILDVIREKKAEQN